MLFVFTLYLIIAMLITLFNRNPNTRNKILLGFSTAFFIFIIGFRDTIVGTDTGGYIATFFDYQYRSWSYIFANPEGGKSNYGFFIFEKIMSLISPNNYIPFLFVSTLITMIPLHSFLKKNSVNVFMSFIMLMTFGILGFFMAGIKQSIAIAILLISYEKLKENNIKLFILFVFIACLFHNTAIVFLLILPIFKMKRKKKLFFIIPILIIMALTMGQSLFSVMLDFIGDSYGDQSAEGEYSSVTLTGLYMQLCVMIAVLIFAGNKLKQDKELSFWTSIYGVGLFFQSMTPFMGEFFRLNMYFSIFGVVLLPRAIQISNIDIKTIQIFKTIIYFVFICSITYFYYDSPYKLSIL